MKVIEAWQGLEAMRLRVATFNIRHGLGTDEVLDLERTARVIRTTGADVVCLQEVDRNLARSGREDQPEVLAALTGMHVGFWPLLERGGGSYGLAVAATEGLDGAIEVLPRAGSEEARGVVSVTFRDVMVLATHLSRDPGSRRLQTRRLAEVVAGAGGPVAVVGDMNQGRSGLAPLLAAGLEAGPRRATLGRRQIDFVLAGRGVVLERVEALRTRASDHRPLVADLIVDQETQPEP